jgi:hypothetical protein
LYLYKHRIEDDENNLGLIYNIKAGLSLLNSIHYSKLKSPIVFIDHHTCKNVELSI